MLAQYSFFSFSCISTLGKWSWIKSFTKSTRLFDPHWRHFLPKNHGVLSPRIAGLEGPVVHVLGLGGWEDATSLGSHRLEASWVKWVDGIEQGRGEGAFPNCGGRLLLFWVFIVMKNITFTHPRLMSNIHGLGKLKRKFSNPIHLYLWFLANSPQLSYSIRTQVVFNSFVILERWVPFVCSCSLIARSKTGNGIEVCLDLVPNILPIHTFILRAWKIVRMVSAIKLKTILFNEKQTLWLGPIWTLRFRWCIAPSTSLDLAPHSFTNKIYAGISENMWKLILIKRFTL